VDTVVVFKDYSHNVKNAKTTA